MNVSVEYQAKFSAENPMVNAAGRAPHARVARKRAGRPDERRRKVGWGAVDA